MEKIMASPSWRINQSQRQGEILFTECQGSHPVLTDLIAAKKFTMIDGVSEGRHPGP